MKKAKRIEKYKAKQKSKVQVALHRQRKKEKKTKAEKNAKAKHEAWLNEMKRKDSEQIQALEAEISNESK